MDKLCITVPSVPATRCTFPRLSDKARGNGEVMFYYQKAGIDARNAGKVQFMSVFAQFFDDVIGVAKQ